MKVIIIIKYKSTNCFLLTPIGFSQLICRCNDRNWSSNNSSTCTGNTCEARLDLSSDEVIFGCHNFTFRFPDCNKTNFEPVRFCCSSYHLCNEDLVQFLPTPGPDSTTTSPPDEAIRTDEATTLPPRGMATSFIGLGWGGCGVGVVSLARPYRRGSSA